MSATSQIKNTTWKPPNFRTKRWFFPTYNHMKHDPTATTGDKIIFEILLCIQILKKCLPFTHKSDWKWLPTHHIPDKIYNTQFNHSLISPRGQKICYAKIKKKNYTNLWLLFQLKLKQWWNIRWRVHLSEELEKNASMCGEERCKHQGFDCHELDENI